MRGIRQGDPLSPFIFVLMMEGLGQLINAKITSHDLKGLTPHGIDRHSHQQLVDDTMLMGKASVQEVRSINYCLNTFLAASGLDINKRKSHIYFFNTCHIMKRNICHILGLYEGTLPSKYLGAPLSDSLLICLLERSHGSSESQTLLMDLSLP